MRRSSAPPARFGGTRGSVELSAGDLSLQLFRRRLSGNVGTDDFARTQDGDAIGDGKRFLDAMGNQHDGAALRAELSKALEQRVRFLQREHRRRFVEEDERASTPQRACDLHPLLLADGELAHDGIERKVPRLVEVRAKQQQVLANRKGRHEHEVLVNDVYSVIPRLSCARKANRVAVQNQLATRGREAAGEDVRESGLAGAVLTQDGVNFAAPQREADVPEGDDIAKLLRDVPYFEFQAQNSNFGTTSFPCMISSNFCIRRSCTSFGILSSNFGLKTTLTAPSFAPTSSIAPR